MDEGGRLQCLSPFTVDIPPGKTAKLVVDQRHETRHGLLVTPAGTLNNLGEIIRRVGWRDHAWASWTNYTDASARGRELEGCYHRGWRATMSRRVLVWIIVLGLLTQGRPLSAQSPHDSLTLISENGREFIPTVRDGSRVLVALDDVIRVFDLEQQGLSSDGTVTVSRAGRAIILTANQQLASVAGQLVELRAAPRTIDGRWLVPLDFLSRALTQILDERLDLRQRSQLLLVGDVKVPRVSGQYRTRGAGGQLTLEVTPEVPYAIRQDGNRLIVTFEADALDIERLPRPRGDLVTSFFAVDASASLGIDLGAAFGSFDASSRSIRNNGVELRVDFRGAERLTDAGAPGLVPEPSGSGPPTAAIDPLPDLRAPPTVRVVAIDAGHGGDDAGTRGADDTLEKDVALSVTRRLREAIESRLGLRVILTRGRDQAVGLDQRAAIANNNKADIFISLHVNTSVRPTATGAEVFYLSMDEYGAEARELAEREAQIVPVIGGGTRAIDLVQWEMAQVRYIDRSARLAGIVHSELNRRIPMSTRDVQKAPFRVLVGANMPAVLIEMGFISNPDDERRLASARFQNAVVDALVASILRFRDYLERTANDDGALEPDVTDTDSVGGAASLQVRDE